MESIEEQLTVESGQLTARLESQAQGWRNRWRRACRVLLKLSDGAAHWQRVAEMLADDANTANNVAKSYQEACSKAMKERDGLRSALAELSGREDHWRDVAAAYEAACSDLAKERDGLKAEVERLKAEGATVQAVTADMNRYYLEWQNAQKAKDAQWEDWQRAVGQVQMLQAELGAQKICCHCRENKADGSYCVRCEDHLREKTLSRILDLERKLKAGVPSPTSSRGGSATGNKAAPAAAPQAIEGRTRSLLDAAEETVGTLRGRLRQVCATLDEEKRGRLAAESAIDELEGRLAGERRAAELAVEHLKVRHQGQKDDLRRNHENAMSALRAMLAEKEREAWHGKLMVEAMRVDWSDQQVADLSEQIWGLMKSGVDGKVLSAGGAIVRLTPEDGHHEGHEGHEGGEEGINRKEHKELKGESDNRTHDGMGVTPV
jgi:molybdopterin converting factor small subunit